MEMTKKKIIKKILIYKKLIGGLLIHFHEN